MSTRSDYASVPSAGKLKLKGVKAAKVDKKNKKSKSKAPLDNDHAEDFQDNSVILKKLEEEDTQMEKESRRKMGVVDGEVVGPGAGVEDEAIGEKLKTEAERRYDEQRRKRVRLRILWSPNCPNSLLTLQQLEERLKREGVKSHKQRVEELNRYLSGLSEHHDMPRIGPG